MWTVGDGSRNTGTAAVIHINDLLARCVLGVSAEERREKQDVVINMSVTADVLAAAAADDFAQTLDYSALKKRVFEFVEASEFVLLETLTERVATLCLEFPQASGVTVRIEKPSALRFARSVAVEITKEREAAW
ncbi:MAG: dihydroneopterin aldolase [Armatimonadia bacterium]